jgi:hypothetical protein
VQAAEAVLARLQAEQRAAPPPAALMPNVRQHYLKVADRLTEGSLADSERGPGEVRKSNSCQVECLLPCPWMTGSGRDMRRLPGRFRTLAG